MNLWHYSLRLAKEVAISFDARRTLLVPGDREASINFAVHHLVQLANFCIASQGYFSIAFCGGSTPIPLIQQLTRPPYLHATDWEKWYLFWSDERNVPHTSSESNFGEAWRAGLHTVKTLREGQYFPMPVGDHLDEQALLYEECIRSTCGTVDVVMLGMGTDGHTASLFPCTAALEEHKRWVVANYVPALKKERLTLTFPGIAAARLVCVYVFGEAKHPALQKVLHPSPLEPLLPAARLGSQEKPVLFFLDRAAYAGISASKELRAVVSS